MRSVVRAPGVSSSWSATSSMHVGGQARQRGHPLLQRLGEVQLTAHRRLGDRGDLALRARAGGQHLDDLALDQRRVDVEDDQPLGPPARL